jgi:hypothetical protein
VMDSRILPVPDTVEDRGVPTKDLLRGAVSVLVERV